MSTEKTPLENETTPSCLGAVSGSLPSVDEAGAMAVKISEMVEPPLTAQEQSFFIAGFCECVKWLDSIEEKNLLSTKPETSQCSDMKEEIIKIMLGWVENNEPIETTADKLLSLFSVGWQSEQLCGDLHSTDWSGKCFKCGEQVFVREPK